MVSVEGKGTGDEEVQQLTVTVDNESLARGDLVAIEV